MKRSKRVVGLGAVALVVVACGPSVGESLETLTASSGAGATPASTFGNIARNEFEFTGISPWEATQHEDSINPAQLAAVRAVAPVSVRAVDIVVTLVMDFNVSPGDRGVALVAYLDGPPPAKPMRPTEGHPLASSFGGQASSTTLSWFLSEMDGSGRSYEFWLQVTALDASGDMRASVVGDGGLVFVDMTPSVAT